MVVDAYAPVRRIGGVCVPAGVHLDGIRSDVCVYVREECFQTSGVACEAQCVSVLVVLADFWLVVLRYSAGSRLIFLGAGMSAEMRIWSVHVGGLDHHVADVC